MKFQRKKVLRWGLGFIILYLAIGILLFLIQEYFLFHPETIPRNAGYDLRQQHEEAEFAFADDTIHYVKFKPVNGVKSRGMVLYFHGNKQHIARYARFTEIFTKLGYEVWMPDYPGFGKSRGVITEEKLYREAEHLFELAIQKTSADSLIIYGKSFGTGIASYLASRKKCRQLILETPYYSIPELFACYAPIYPVNQLSRFKIPVFQYLQAASSPIYIFHGTRDAVIPYESTVQLQPLLKSSDQFITIPDGTHHNIYEFPQYQTKMDSLLRFK